MKTRQSTSASSKIPFYVGREAISNLISYLNENNISNLVLVCDDNQYKALGDRVEKSLIQTGFNIKSVILQGEEIGADEESVVQVLMSVDDTDHLFLAVGSGTITDIVRFVSYRAKSYFISLPTAPSVDGFASDGSAMTFQNLKQTVISRPPLAIFADLDTLINAPDPLIAAGFGDMFGKFTALADWKLANLINGDVYDQSTAERSRLARDKVVEEGYLIKNNREKSILSLMESLYEEGLCMLDFGASRPASGAEHSFSHYWETILLLDGRPAVLHGAKVGLASILIAKYFQMLGRMTLDEAKTRLENTPKFDPKDETEKILKGFGEHVAPSILEIQQPHINLTGDKYHQLQTNIINRWSDIQQITQEVPSPDEMRSMLKNVGGKTEPGELGLTDSDIQNAMEFAQYIRNSFTILNVFQMLGCRPQN